MASSKQLSARLVGTTLVLLVAFGYFLHFLSALPSKSYASYKKRHLQALIKEQKRTRSPQQVAKQSSSKTNSNSTVSSVTKQSASKATVPGYDKAGYRLYAPITQDSERILVSTTKESARGKPELAKKNSGPLMLQIGSFADQEQADRMRAQLLLLDFEAKVTPVKINNKTWHRVQVGPFASEKALKNTKKRLDGYKINALLWRETQSG